MVDATISYLAAMPERPFFFLYDHPQARLGRTPRGARYRSATLGSSTPRRRAKSEGRGPGDTTNRRSRPTAPRLPITRAPENLHLGQHPVVVRWPEHPALRAARLVEDDAARDDAAAGVRAGREQDEVHAPRREWALEPHGLPDRETRRGGVGLSERVDEA